MHVVFVGSGNEVLVCLYIRVGTRMRQTKPCLDESGPESLHMERGPGLPQNAGEEATTFTPWRAIAMSKGKKGLTQYQPRHPGHLFAYCGWGVQQF
jgi:hypothetical protein